VQTAEISLREKPLANSDSGRSQPGADRGTVTIEGRSIVSLQTRGAARFVASPRTERGGAPKVRSTEIVVRGNAAGTVRRP
jgi:hypothetical protein